MSTKDACEAIGVTLPTLYRFIGTGDLPAHKLGRLIRLRRSEIEDFIQRQRIKAGDLNSKRPEPGVDRSA